MAYIVEEFYPKLKPSQFVKWNRVYENDIQFTATNYGLIQNKIPRMPWYNNIV